MSLVNKMLRDLDARRVGDGDRAALPAAVTPLAARQDSSQRLVWRLLGAILMAIGLGVVAWYAAQHYRTPTPANVPDAVPTSVPVPNTVVPILRMDDQLSERPLAGASRKAVTAVPSEPMSPLVIAAPLQPTVRLPSAPSDSSIDKQVRLPSPAERADIEYRRGIVAHRQGRAEEAAGNYRAALEDYPEHAAARQTLAALLIEAKHFDDAEELLRKGTELPSVRLPSTLALARLKVERNQVPAALELLQKNAAFGERSAEYQGFTGALLNRAGRAAEAAERYLAATALAPGEGRWWAGLGIALETAGKVAEAREAYQKARALPGLPADLAQHVEQRLR
jgi:MSHA biogenesis protein MshN